MKKYLLPENGKFYKANLHTHSNLSDGEMTVEELKKIYSEHGYSVLAFTDHDIFIRHNDLTDDKFLALNGYEMEIHPEQGDNQPKIKTCHMCLVALSPETEKQVCYHREKYLFGNAVNHKNEIVFDASLPDYERYYTHECISDMMKKGREGGFFVTYNHPTWSGENYNDYIGFENMHAMEIYNHECYLECEEYNPRVYDDFLRAGKKIFCVSTDDVHLPVSACGGFTMIKADKLEYTAVTDALLKGNFYSSTGPAIEELYIEGDTVTVKTSPAKTIKLSTGIRHLDKKIAKEGEFVTEAQFKIKPHYQYFRITVVDEFEKRANTNAYFTEDLLK